MTWITAEDALAQLGTKPQTLYANVSRGKIRAKPDAVDSRRSLYLAEDVMRLAGRQSGRQRNAVVATQAIRWGDPVLDTAISTVAHGRLFYRGHDAGSLAATATLEDVACLLWQSDTCSVSGSGGNENGQPDIGAAISVLAARSVKDFPNLGRSPAVLRTEAASVLSSVVSALAPKGSEGAPIHQRLALSFGRPDASESLRHALVLLAEHELNASTFAARVCASAGASLSASVLAGMATLTGPRHGSAWRGVSALVENVDRLGAEEAIRCALGDAGTVSGFGHPLYPLGDPRADALMATFEVPVAYQSLANAGKTLLGESPNIDLALAAMTVRFGLPETAPLVIFALARTVGWLAHAIEQAQSTELIRPRANYVGPALLPP